MYEQWQVNDNALKEGSRVLTADDDGSRPDHSPEGWERFSPRQGWFSGAPNRCGPGTGKGGGESSQTCGTVCAKGGRGGTLLL